uniref:WASH complex subunit strumpellin n=1 Tax=Macrostomum lignano TaxID=282301 RepID=A0A1I8IVV1_9PLAT
MSDFLAEGNLCGRNLLKIVSSGSSIISELLNLSAFVPNAFKQETNAESQRYHEIIFDFEYLRTPEFFENKIQSRAELQDLDEEFRENHLEILTRFYKTFESVYSYVIKLNTYLSDLENGIYVQQMLETVLLNPEGKQLLCESLALYGIMLLTVEAKFPGPLRERLLVAYYRHSSGSSTQIDDVCKLLRSTEYDPSSPHARRPAKYPESYFSRVPINPRFVQMVIDRLRSDDVYSMVASFPFPEHREHRPGSPGCYAILQICCTWRRRKCEKLLTNSFRIIGVLSLHMGMLVNLAEAWQPYKAAAKALANSIALPNAKRQAAMHGAKVGELLARTADLLKEGVLVENLVLDRIPQLLNAARDCNVTLRWLMLHTRLRCLRRRERSRLCKQLRDSSRFNGEQLFQLLLLTAQFEFRLKEVFTGILSRKADTWEALKVECSERLRELSDVFSGTKPLTRVAANAKLQDWFANLAAQVDKLDFANATESGRKVDQLMQALAREFHQLDANMQVVQFLQETCAKLYQMMRIINVKEEVLLHLDIVADLSYAWVIIDTYTNFMQVGIQRNPRITIQLKAMFLKLATAMEQPLLRISQANSPDLASALASTILPITYVRKVLQVIPKTMFKRLAEIISIQTHKLKELPTRLDKDKVKDYGMLEERYQVSQLTHEISTFSEGILAMKTTLVGIVKLDPQKLLEDGIRKRAGCAELMSCRPGCVALGERMDGFRRSFEYIQDYVNIYGLKIWQEEVSRIINYNVEQECNSFLREKVQDFQSVYQSKAIPIPKFPPPAGDRAVNFIGRLATELLRVTDPNRLSTIYQIARWPMPGTAKSRQEVLNSRVWPPWKRRWTVSACPAWTACPQLHAGQRFADFAKAISASHKLAVDQLTGLADLMRPFDSLLLPTGQPPAKLLAGAAPAAATPAAAADGQPAE